MSTCDSVIVHYGPPEPTIALACAALRWSESVIVVANDLRDRPTDCPAGVDWLVPTRNLGFGEALNLACEISKSDVLLALNNDIVLDAEDVHRCLSEFIDPSVAVVGPVLRFEDGTVQSAAGRLSAVLQLPIMDLTIPDSPRDCVWVTGAVMGLRRETLANIKMDGAFFLGCEDVDYCLRVAQAGGRVRIVPCTRALHYGSVVLAGPRWHYYVTRNPIWLTRKHRPGMWWAMTFAHKSLMTVRVVIADLVKRRGSERSVSSLHGLADSMRNKPLQQPWSDEPRPSSWLTW
jgi:GT2 family glycosyltransferase